MRSRRPPGVAESHGMWLCPNTTTSASGNAASHRRSRPCLVPVSCTTAHLRPARSKRASIGSRRVTAGSSLLPWTPTRTRALSLTACKRSALTQSPACTTKSASLISRQTLSGRARARVGRCVSLIRSTRDIVTVDRASSPLVGLKEWAPSCRRSEPRRSQETWRDGKGRCRHPSMNSAGRGGESERHWRLRRTMWVRTSRVDSAERLKDLAHGVAVPSLEDP